MSRICAVVEIERQVTQNEMVNYLGRCVSHCVHYIIYMRSIDAFSLHVAHYLLLEAGCSFVQNVGNIHAISTSECMIQKASV